MLAESARTFFGLEQVQAEGGQDGAQGGVHRRRRAGDQRPQDYEGTLHIHREFTAAIAERRLALTSFRECVGTMRLTEQLEGGPYDASERPARAESPAMA